MIKKVAVLATAMAVTVGGVAYGGVDVGPGNGNPDTNPTGKCSPGQNKETSVGGWKKCPN